MTDRRIRTATPDLLGTPLSEGHKDRRVELFCSAAAEPEGGCGTFSFGAEIAISCVGAQFEHDEQRRNTQLSSANTTDRLGSLKAGVSAGLTCESTL